MESFCKLLSDPALPVREVATAAMCNMLLEFSPLKKVALELHVIPKLVAGLSKKNSVEVQNNSVRCSFF